jgi:DNA polymerase elongation subunit (family B)
MNKKKVFVIRKNQDFRLIDFHVYDSNKSAGAGNSSSDEEEKMKRKKGDNATFTIQMFGVNETGETASITIQDYLPFFYVKVGEKWGQYEAISLLADLKLQLTQKYGNGKQLVDSVLDAELVEYNKLYGFSAGKKDKFVKITFKNQNTLNKVKGLWYYYAKDNSGNNNTRRRSNLKFQGIELELYESNIPPLLRYFHIYNISPSGWVSVQSSSRTIVPDDSRTTTCKFEFCCNLSQIRPLPEKETRVPYKICSFDIEASSSHGDFPVPIKTYKRLATNAVDVFLLQKQFLDKERGGKLLEKILLRAFQYGACDDIDTIYPKEMPAKALVEKMSKVLIKESVENVKKTVVDASKTKSLTVEAIFEELKKSQAGAGGDGGEEGGGDSSHVAGGSNEVEEVVNRRPTAATTKTKVEKTATIIDILLSEQYDRDEKIQIVNDTMTRILPPVKGDEVTFIGSTFMNYGETQPYLNHCLVVGSCDPIEGIKVECADDENDLLIRWTKLIQEENPDIIIGYNIFGFDYEFMFRRAQENHCERDFLMLSRQVGEVCGTVDREGDLNIENTKLAIASGEYDLRFPRMAGRLQVDMYAYFRRDFNLSSYKLDDVAGQFIGDDVKKTACLVHPQYGNVTELYSQNLTGLNRGDFIHIELTSFTTDYYKDGQKFRVVDIERGRTDSPTSNVILIDGHHEIDSGKSVKWGMAKDDVTPQDIFRLTRGSSSDRAIVAKYCVQDCNLVHHLMNKIDVITGYVEMSSICSVPISFLVFRGQGIKLTSYVAKKCREKDTLMPDLEKTSDADGYEGAIVLPPKCSMYMDNPVACVDYSSLYPSSMISQNYSHDSKVWTREYDLAGNLIKVTGERDASGNFVYDNLPGEEYIDIEFDTFRYIRKTPTSRAEKTKSGKMTCRWAQNKKGVMPSILEELLKARSDTRKKIKTEKDPFMQNILDKRQLGYKVTANSLYGQCGSRTSTFYERDVAASTTATGRMMITYAKRIIEDVYGDMVYETAHGSVRTKAEYVYGDTDSVFFTFNLENPETGEKIRGKPALEMTIEIAQDAAQLCTQWLKPPMELSYEKTLMPFVLLSKKRYVGMLYETDPKKGKLKYMGLSLKRRDSCDYLKDVYGEILNILMKKNDIQASIQFLEKSLDDLIQGKVPMDKLAITKALRSDYKNPQQIGHKVLADRMGKRDPGNKPKPGDRIKFVFIVNPDPKALMGDKIETPEYIIEKKLQIDYAHYITNQLMKPLQQLFGLALEPIWEFRRKTSAIRAYRAEIKQLEEEFPDVEVFMKKREKLCSAKVKTLLFDDVLTKILNKKNHVQPISAFFHRK